MKLPAYDAPGQIVIIGDPKANGEMASMFIAWTPWGRELELLAALKLEANAKSLKVLGCANATYGEVAEFKAQHVADQMDDYWFFRARAVMAGAAKFVPELKPMKLAKRRGLNVVARAASWKRTLQNFANAMANEVSMQPA